MHIISPAADNNVSLLFCLFPFFTCKRLMSEFTEQPPPEVNQLNMKKLLRHSTDIAPEFYGWSRSPWFGLDFVPHVELQCG